MRRCTAGLSRLGERSPCAATETERASAAILRQGPALAVTPMRRFVLPSPSGAGFLRLLWERQRAECVAASIAVSALPLLAGWVPPNDYYGFRTPQSMVSPEAWYRANEIMACYLLASQALAIRAKRHVVEALTARWDRDEATWATPWICVAALLGVLGSVAHFYLLG